MTGFLKLEIGAGQSPVCVDDLWVHNDLNPFPHIEHVCQASEIDLPDGSCDYITMRGVFEHFTYKEADAALRNIHRMLVKDGVLEVHGLPDALSYVSAYFKKDCCCPGLMYNQKLDPPHYRVLEPSLAWLIRAMYGWQRWPGDEHKSLWTDDLIEFYFGPLFHYAVEREHLVGPGRTYETFHYEIKARKKIK